MTYTKIQGVRYYIYIDYLAEIKEISFYYYNMVLGGCFFFAPINGIIDFSKINE